MDCTSASKHRSRAAELRLAAAATPSPTSLSWRPRRSATVQAATVRLTTAFPSAGDALESRTLLAATSIAGLQSVETFIDTTDSVEFRTIDGTGNAIGDAGAAHTNLVRLADADYGDGVSSLAGDDRASARAISNAVADQDGDTLNTLGRTDFLWLWGQFIDHDLDLTEAATPEEAADIAVPTGDAFFDPTGSGEATIGFNRSIHDESSGQREQINEITAFIDGSMVYGSDAERAAALRTFEGGRLKVTHRGDGDLLPFNVEGLPNAGGTRADLFLAGDVRANENVYLTAMHTLWVREHNRLADEIAEAEPSLDDEQIYQQARRLVVAQVQAITYNEWLPALVGSDAVSEYRGYDATVDPSIANEFSTAAFRFGHSLLPSTLFVAGDDGEALPLELRNAFFRPDQVDAIGVDNLLGGAALGLSSELDEQIVDDLRNFLFGQPGAGGFDLVSLNIQRGRDHGLASYNDTREALGLPRARSFAAISSDADVQAKLAEAYDSVDEVDLWVGGLAEDAVRGSMLGATFHAIVVDQFERLRDGDRFYYENEFGRRQAAELGSTRLADVITRNTDQTLVGNVFINEQEAQPRRDDALFARQDRRGGRDDQTIAVRTEVDGDGSLRAVQRRLTLDGSLRELRVDLNGDGQLDPVTARRDGFAVGLTQPGRLDPLQIVELRLAPTSELLGGDFDGDGVDELVSFDRRSGFWHVYEATPDNGLAPERWGRWGTGVEWLDITVGDFDGDDRDDVVARNAVSGELFVARSAGFEFRTEAWGRWSADVPWESVQRADLDGDGRDDLIGRNPYGGMVYAAMSTIEAGGEGDEIGFENQAIARLSSAFEWTDLHVGDFNGDGADDLAGRLAHTGAWYCAAMPEPGQSEAPMHAWGRWSHDVDWRGTVVGDFDADGVDDLMARHGETDDLFVALGSDDGFNNRRIGRLV